MQCVKITLRSDDTFEQIFTCDGCVGVVLITCTAESTPMTGIQTCVAAHTCVIGKTCTRSAVFQTANPCSSNHTVSLWILTPCFNISIYSLYSYTKLTTTETYWFTHHKCHHGARLRPSFFLPSFRRINYVHCCECNSRHILVGNPIQLCVLLSYWTTYFFLHLLLSNNFPEHKNRT